MMRWIFTLLILAASLDQVSAEDCPSVAGIVLGSILGTVALVALVLLILYLVWRSRNKQDKEKKAKRRENAEDHTYDNPTFQAEEDSPGKTSPVKVKVKDDLGGQKRVNTNGVRDNVDGSFTVQVDQPGHVGNGSNLFQGTSPRGAAFGAPLQKTGSRGSLDNSYPLSEAEIITVSMQSQDIIGLGFNICGSMSEGIFVSQVHNRGPASESGLVKAGDRLLSISISFENIVYEDALTILSYASPYPVELQIQKPGKTSPQNVTEVEAGPDKVSHPLYRSQSMDDVNKIGSKENYITPRRTYSEMKKSAPVISGSASNGAMLDDAGGMLKKWDAKENILREDSLKQIPSFGSADLNLDPSSMMMQANASAQEGQQELEDDFKPDVFAKLRKSSASSASSTEGYGITKQETVVNIERSPGEDHNMSNMSSATTSSVVTVIEAPGGEQNNLQHVPEGGEGGTTKMYVENETGVTHTKKRRSSTSSSSSGGRGEEPSSARVPDSESRPGAEGDMGEPRIEATRVDHGSTFTGGTNIPLIVHSEFSDTREDEMSLNDSGFNLNASRVLHLDPSSDSLNVNYDESEFPGSNITNGPSSIAEEDTVKKVDVERRRDQVLEEFFGDSPSLLERFGLGPPENMKDKSDDESAVLTKTVTVTNDDGTVTTKVITSDELRSDSSSSPHSSRSSSPTPREGEDENKQKWVGDISPVIKKKSDGGLAFDISADKFKDMPNQMPQEEERGIPQPTGGIAYYVSIDDQYNVSPAQPVYGMGEPDPSGQQPLLMRSHAGYRIPRDTTSDVNQKDIKEEQRKLQEDAITELRERELKFAQAAAEDNNNEPSASQKTSKLLVHLSSSSDMNGQEESPVTTPPAKAATDTNFTLVSHNEIRGAYTMTVNPESSNPVEDSEA